MDPINPWLDPAEVRRMAEKLMRPALQPAVSVADAGFDAGFVGYAPENAAAPQAPAPHPAPAPAPTPVPLPAPYQTATIASPPVAEPEISAPPLVAPAPVPTPALPPPLPTPAPITETIASSARGSFLERIHRFRDWMHHHFSATGIFILDREGAVIFDESNHGRLHFLARSLALASRRPGASAGNVHVKIGAGATLEVIPVDTAYGNFVLGAVVPEALQPAAVAAVVEALGIVATPPNHAGSV